MDAIALAQAAEGLLGTPFRLHGRDPATGLDCIGLAAEACRRAGIAADPPRHYALRNRSIEQALPHARRSGFATVQGPIQPGDLVLVSPGPAQHHLLVAALEAGFVHAHAGLRQVVLTPAPLPWPILHHWRLAAPSERS